MKELILTDDGFIEMPDNIAELEAIYTAGDDIRKKQITKRQNENNNERI